MIVNSFKHTILIVEDEPTNIFVLNELLKNKYNIRVATSGEKAESLIASGKLPDLILLDIIMPGKSGYEVCTTLKNIPIIKDIPIIFLSGKNETEEIVKGFKLGAADFVTKPFKPEELLTRVETQLNLLDAKIKLEKTNQTLLQRNIEIESGMETARLLQRNLLPNKKLIAPWIEAYFCFIPMDKVGGDFYDYRVDNNIVELFIADVSGHGLPGALFSTIAKVAKESITNKNSPSAILKHLNELMCRYTVESHFITAFSCIMDYNTKTMKYSSAGHCPLIIQRKNETNLIKLKTKGYPLGIIENFDYIENTYQFEPGDRIIIYTDGILECTKLEGEHYKMWGNESFDKFILNHTNYSPNEFCSSILAVLSNYCGEQHFDDDITLGVVDIK